MTHRRCRSGWPDGSPRSQRRSGCGAGRRGWCRSRRRRGCRCRCRCRRALSWRRRIRRRRLRRARRARWRGVGARRAVFAAHFFSFFARIWGEGWARGERRIWARRKCERPFLVHGACTPSHTRALTACVHWLPPCTWPDFGTRAQTARSHWLPECARVPADGRTVPIPSGPRGGNFRTASGHCASADGAWACVCVYVSLRLARYVSRAAVFTIAGRTDRGTCL